jgi:hypothetical protein
MNPLFVAAVYQIIFAGLMFVAGFLVRWGVWSQEDAVKYMGGLALGLIGLGGMLWNKYKDRIKIVTALSSEKPMTENQLESQIAGGETAPANTPKHEVPEVTPPTNP